MKLNYKILLIFFFFLVISVNTSYAIVGSEKRTMEEIREELRNRIAEAEASKEAARKRVQERVELRKEQNTELKGKLDEMRKKNITKFFNNMMEKLSKAVLRMEKIALKIETRLGKMNKKGIDTAALETKLTGTRAEMEKIKADIGTAKASLETILSSGTPKEEFVGVKEVVKNIWTAIKNIHQSLAVMITEMKGMSGMATIKPTEPPEAL